MKVGDSANLVVGWKRSVSEVHVILELKMERVKNGAI
jgi:hypothetical protein